MTDCVKVLGTVQPCLQREWGSSAKALVEPEP